MKKIVFTRSNPVSPDPRVEKEVDCLNEAGYNVSVIAWDRSEKYKIKADFLDLKSGKVKIHRFGIPATFGDGMRNLAPFIKFQIRLFKWLWSNKNTYDIVHACDFDTALTAMIVSKFTKKRLIFDIFDYLSTNPTSMFKKTIKFFENSIINKANGVIICTEQRKKQIAGTKPKKLIVIHNSPEEITSAVNKDDFNEWQKAIKIAYVGILQEHRLLKEISEVIVKMENIELHIGGFGKYENYFNELSKTNNNIKYYGKLSYNDTIELEKKCDILMAVYAPYIGNHYYAAPNKFYEAMMLGKPLIMVKNTGMSDVVADNETGVLIEYTKESFEKGLLELINQKSKWNDMNIKMKEIYRSQFSWKEMKRRLVEFYEEI
jgi:glycosyltransferase involved in cell wall biosynthesis